MSRGRRWPGGVIWPAVFIAAAPAAAPSLASAQEARAADESFFVETLHPMLHALQCERCHSDNGVASETQLMFPEVDADAARITAFGLALMDLVDRRDPERSLLLRKPTNLVKHTGGR